MTTQSKSRAHRWSSACALLMICVMASVANAAAISYTVKQPFDSGIVTGSITTDGTLGVLATSNITSWSLHLVGKVGGIFDLNTGNSGRFIAGSNTTATATGLYYDFSGAGSDYLLFQVSFGDSTRYYCNAATFGVCADGKSNTPGSYLDADFANSKETGTQLIGSVRSVPVPAGLPLLGAAMFVLGFNRRRRSA